MVKENLIVLTGPTGIGKTDLSLELAEYFKSEIISADSMQIYKYMDIGTAKIKPSEMKGIEHHMLDFIYPDVDFTVSNYRDMAKTLIRDINQSQKSPILVGGTGLYINSLVYDLNFASVPPNQKIRDYYENLATSKGNEYLHNMLCKIDKESGKKIHIADLRRIIRALEIYDLTGKTMSEYNKNFRQENTDYNLLMICLDMDRGDLYRRINLRVDRMLENGLVEEVENILKMGYSKNLTSLQAIGYKEIIMYLEGDISLEDAAEMIKKASRNYAKRQLTWFRRDKRFQWVNRDDFSSSASLKDWIIEYIEDNMKYLQR